MTPTFPAQLRQSLLAVATIAIATAALLWLQPHANLITVALVLLLSVTIVASRWGGVPGLISGLCGALSLNYFFIPPVRTWRIANPQNWIAFFVFLATSLLVGQLSSRARRRAEEAEARRAEIERLYTQLHAAFEQASEAETLRRSERLKTALLDSVTHDLRTPLTSIKASVTTLLGGDADDAGLPHDARRELLEVINQETDRLDRFVGEMMELARLEGGQLPLHPAPTSALDIINHALDRAASLVRRHPVEVSIADRLPPLLVDAFSISSVVFELLENAAKYSPEGSAIHVTARHLDGATAQLAVEDEGRGIPAELRTRVFQKFFRATKGEGDGQGFGLGLAIARGIVEAHGGKIWVDAAERARGTVVAFTVPCQP